MPSSKGFHRLIRVFEGFYQFIIGSSNSIIVPVAFCYRNDPRGLDKCRLSASVGASYMGIFADEKYAFVRVSTSIRRI